jgi:tetratricopeptide (TPR) repeat protein
MKIRPKTIRRLLILAAGAVILSSVVGVAFTARRWSRESQIAAARTAGISAFESHEYPKALESLGKYILSRPNDVEALFALGCARMEMETPNRDYLFDARLRFQQLLVIDPNHVPASLKLLEVYEKTNQSAEMLELSNSLLERAPRTATAMRYKAIALTRLKNAPEARRAWQALVELTPDDVNAQSQLLTAMRADGQDTETVIAYAQKLVEDHPADPRFSIPLATALRDAGREGDSLAVLKKLTSNPPADPIAVVELVTMLDRAGAFDDAQRVLQQAAGSLNSSLLNAALVQRVWQAGRPDEVLALTEKMMKDGRAQPTVLALRALSLASLNRRDEAALLVSKLTDGETASGRAWSEALRVEFSTTPFTPPQRVDILTKALGRDPNNGILYTWLARALMQVGEVDQAARCYRESAQRMPSWTTPCLELAQAMLGAGRTDDAIPAAKAAFLRSPSSVAAQVQLARVRYAALQQRFDVEEQSMLLKFVAKLREQLKDEPTLLPIHVALLARSGDKNGATALISSVLSAQPNAASLLSLYQVDQQFSLGQSETILRLAQDASQVSAELLTAYASDLVAKGELDRAAELAKTLSQSSALSPSAALAEARIHSMLGNADAASTWRMAATRFPDNLALQVAALDEAVGLINDRAFQQHLIDRVRALTGENALYWRIEQAKFLASSDNLDDSRQALTLASELLRQQPTRVDLRVLLGRVLTRLDSRATALEHLRAAYDQAPSNPSIGLELVDAFMQLGRVTDAQAVLKRLSSIDIEDTSARNRVARVLLENGMTLELLAMLQRAQDRHFLDPAGSLLLAETLASSEQTDAATKLYGELIGKSPSPALLASAAAHQREIGNLDAATSLLSQIASAPGTAASRQYAVARYHAKFGEVDAAREAFNLAVVDPSCDLVMLRDAIAMECTARNFDHGQKLLDLGRRRFGSSTVLERAQIELDAIRGGESDLAMNRLIDVLSKNPSAKAEVDALRASVDARKSGKITPELAVTLVQLANRYPAAFDLQREAISACIAVNQSGPAVSIAHRLASMSQSRADMQELAARTLANFGQWNGARKIAERWRTLVPAAPREPDLLLSAIAQASGKPDQSLQISEPYVGSLKPEQDLPSITARAAALMSVGRVSDCYQMLQPWIDQSSEVRAIWLNSILAGPAEQACARLEQVIRVVPPGAAQERIRFAAACLEVSERTEGDQASTLGLALVTPFAEVPEALESTRILRAELLRAGNEPALAEAELRSTLTRFPDSGRVKNSLAYLLLSQARGDEEALRLANEAAAALPNHPTVIDTQARALMAQGDLAGANTRFRDALRLDPDYVDALIGLAGVFQRQGNALEAQTLIARVDELLSKNTIRVIPAHLRGELGVLRQSLSGSQD